MSAASPKPQDKVQEPSMEEILASIRRIMADDQEPSRDEPEPVPEAIDDVLELSEVAQVVRRPQPVSFDPPEIDFREAPVPAPRPLPVPPPAPRQAPMSAQPAPERLEDAIERETVERLVSKDTGDSVGQAFQSLAHTVLSHNARTLEDLVKDMLRPMLKAWLDDNLPSMVERLVRAEIERVARGR